MEKGAPNSKTQEQLEAENEQIHRLIAGLYHLIQTIGFGEDPRVEALLDFSYDVSEESVTNRFHVSESLTKARDIFERMKTLALEFGVVPAAMSTEKLEDQYELMGQRNDAWIRDFRRAFGFDKE